jgi:flagellar protein FlaG
MPTAVDMATLHLNLTSNASPQQRLDILIQSAEQMPESAGVASNVDSLSIFSGPLGDQVSELNEVMRQYGLRFELSEFDSRVITQVVDRETGEIIRQIPAEEILKISEAFASDNGGRLLDASA